MIAAADIAVRLGPRDVLASVDLRAGAGEVVALLGPNGAGKSTLLKAIAGLLVHRGRLRLNGRDASALTASARARLVAYLPQGQEVDWPITARDAVAIGRFAHGGGPGRLSAADLRAVDFALSKVDATHLSERRVTELSGGERARVLLARALAVEAPILLADEPVAALDPAHQLEVMAILKGVAKAGGTVLVALHDLGLATRFADRVLVLDGGRVAAAGEPLAVLDDPTLARVFGIRAARLGNEGLPVLVPWSTMADSRR